MDMHQKKMVLQQHQPSGFASAGTVTVFKDSYLKYTAVVL